MGDNIPDEGIEQQPLRRRRPPLSCVTCRRRKLKCDRCNPCGQCVRSKTTDECVFTGAEPSTNRQMSPPASRPMPSVAHEPRPGMYVFDSKTLSKTGSRSSRVAKRRPDELTEMKQRLKALENSLRSNVRTPATSVDMYSEIDTASTSENVGVDDRVRYLPDASFRGKKSKTRYFGRSHYTTTISFVSVT